MRDDVTLSPVELASLDLLITVAQSRGLSLEDRVTNTQEQAEAQAEHAEAMWEARHGSLDYVETDRETLRRVRELSVGLETAPTLGQLLELRAQAVRG